MNITGTEVRDAVNGTCAMIPPAERASTTVEEGTARTNFWVGVILSIIADAIIAVSLNVQKTAHMRNEGPDGKPKKGYWRIPLWWIGLLLNMVGEVGNMLAYGFAPASVVAPVGSVGVFFNEIIAVLFLKEPFRRRDAFGLAGVIAGVVLIILGVPEGKTPLNAAILLSHFYSNPLAYGYLILLTCMVLFFIFYLEPRYAQRSIFVWLLLCSIISSVTVICARGWSSMLTQFVGGDCGSQHCVGVQLFSPCMLTIGHWLFWTLIVLVVITAIWSAIYLNKAMMIYGNTEVVPVYYCTFTLISIIGGAVVYREFSTMTITGGILFGVGCIGAFGGVYLITSGRKAMGEGGSTEADGGRGFHDLSAVGRAAELQRQRRSSSLQPVGAPLMDLLSFRRDDAILTDVNAIAEKVACEMYAGEHLQAAYRVHDSMGPQAIIAAGLRRLSHRVSLGGVNHVRGKSSIGAGAGAVALGDMRPSSLVIAMEEGTHAWSPRGVSGGLWPMAKVGVLTPTTPAKVDGPDACATMIPLPPGAANALDVHFLAEDNPFISALRTIGTAGQPAQAPLGSPPFASPLANRLRSPRSGQKWAPQTKLSPVREPDDAVGVPTDQDTEAATAEPSGPAPIKAPENSLPRQRLGANDIVEVVISVTYAPSAPDPYAAARAILRHNAFGWSSRVDSSPRRGFGRASLALATCGGHLGSGGSTASTASTSSHRNHTTVPPASSDAVRRLSLLEEINEDALGLNTPISGPTIQAKQGEDSTPSAQSPAHLNTSNDSVLSTGGGASPDRTDTSPQSSVSSTISPGNGHFHNTDSERI